MLAHHVHVILVFPITLIDFTCLIVLVVLQLGQAHQKRLQFAMSRYYAIQDGQRGFIVHFSALRHYSALL